MLITWIYILREFPYLSTSLIIWSAPSSSNFTAESEAKSWHPAVGQRWIRLDIEKELDVALRVRLVTPKSKHSVSSTSLDITYVISKGSSGGTGLLSFESSLEVNLQVCLRVWSQNVEGLTHWQQHSRLKVHVWGEFTNLGFVHTVWRDWNLHLRDAIVYTSLCGDLVGCKVEKPGCS